MNERDRFDKFTERARKVLSLSQEEAQRFQHHYIGTEHLLLGLVREGEGIAAGVLESMGVNLEKVRTQTIQVLSQSGVSQKMEGTHVELTVQLMTTQLNKALDALASVLREKE